jgi:AcrR family transcriptional regulator
MSNARRTPQQERGERRLAQLLESAALVMTDVGYDAATMTAIAERAGASIGALYQYFPNKEAVVRALRHQYAGEIEALWLPLTAKGSRLGIRQLVDRIIDMFVDYIERRPAYFPVLSAPGNYKRDPVMRNRLREHFAALFRERHPEMSRETAFRVANVTVQVLKGMSPLYAEAKGGEKEGIVREFKLVLVSYLSSRLKAD